MNETKWIENIDRICQKDIRYHRDAYLFIQHVLDYTVSKLNKSKTRSNGHVNGRELLQGLREYALQEYGPLAYTVLQQWGIDSCRDVGNIVFNMVNSNLLGKTENDKLEDFDEGFDFREAFVNNFSPKQKPRKLKEDSTENL